MARLRTRIAFLLLALFVCAGVRTAFAAEPTVTAVLSNSETSVGEPVELQIQVTGASNPKPPSQLEVDGLEFQSTGTSRQYQMQNFDITYSFTFTYMVTAQRAGRFTIPPQVVEVGGKQLKTPELTLNAEGSSGRSQSQGRGSTNANIDPSQIGFVEMLLPKSVAYVGEVIPVQIRLGLNMRAPVESLGAGIQVAGQGFTTQKMTEPRQTIETINGRSYQVFIVKTAISPARSGKLEIGPAEINPVVRIPRPGTRNPSMQRGGPFDDPFFNSFFNDPALAPSMPKEVHLKSESATLEVKPLPPKAPPEFAGALGNFSMKVDVNPKKAAVGDPITVTATITGRGNFDRVAAPSLEDDSGWHKYPPSDKFKQDDDVGISGAKTFEIVLSAKENKQTLPPLVFSYFDPVKEQYVTLRSEAIPLHITGGSAPAATPAQAAAAALQNAPSPTASATSPPKQADDILPQLDERTGAPQTFQPLYEQRSFWLAQLLPLLVLLGFIAWSVQHARSNNRELKRTARLQHEAAESQKKMRRDGSSPQEYLADAARTVQLKTALAKNVNANTVDAETAAATFRLDENERARLRQLFDRSDEARYSGGRNGHDALSAEQRREIMDLVEHLRV
ncbi:MAG: BatD family protein [Chthoniobacterales bacterium]